MGEIGEITIRQPQVREHREFRVRPEDSYISPIAWLIGNPETTRRLVKKSRLDSVVDCVILVLSSRASRGYHDNSHESRHLP
jgi:hypothetical protein